MELTVTSIKKDRSCSNTFFVTIEQRSGCVTRGTTVCLNKTGDTARVELMNRNPFISVNTIGEVKLADIEIDIIQLAMRKVQQFQED